MLQLYKNIKARRLELKMTQTELAQKTGYASKSMIAKIEKGQVDLPQTKIIQFAAALQITPSDLMGWDEVSEKHYPKTVRIPVLGRVAAGGPKLAEEEYIDWEDIPEQWGAPTEYFGLRINGDSMAPRINIGDVVIVRKQSDADSGDIVIASVNGDEATCKRLQKYESGITLLSLNPIYEPMHFTKKEIKDRPVSIWGRVVELRAKF